MHPIYGADFLRRVPGDPGSVARQAIANGNMAALGWQLAYQPVDLNTQDAQGVTLLMEAVRQRSARALSLLIDDAAARHITPQLMLRNNQGNTVLHYMAMHLPDAWFDYALGPSELLDTLEIFFEEFRLLFDWPQHNADGLTAIGLAETVHKDNLVRFLEPYEASSVGTSASNGIESEPSSHSNSDDPGGDDHGLRV